MKKLAIFIALLSIILTACNGDNKEQVLDKLEDKSVGSTIEKKGYKEELDGLYIKTDGEIVGSEDEEYPLYTKTYVYTAEEGNNSFTLVNIVEEIDLSIVVFTDDDNDIEIMIYDEEHLKYCEAEFDVDDEKIEYSQCNVDEKIIKKDVDKTIDLFFEELGKILN